MKELFLDNWRRLRYWFEPVHRKDALWLTIFALFGGLLPLYGGAFFIWVLLSDFSWSNLVDHGEFAIYSASFLSTALYFVSREYKVQFPERAAWVLATAILLVLSVFIFSAAAAAVNNDDFQTNINKFAIRVVSPILFSITLVFVFTLTVRGQGLEPRRDVAETVEAVKGDRMSKLQQEFERTAPEEKHEETGA